VGDPVEDPDGDPVTASRDASWLGEVGDVMVTQVR
jgi:hypothetical protein